MLSSSVIFIGYHPMLSHFITHKSSPHQGKLTWHFITSWCHSVLSTMLSLNVIILCYHFIIPDTWVACHGMLCFSFHHGDSLSYMMFSLTPIFSINFSCDNINSFFLNLGWDWNKRDIQSSRPPPSSCVHPHSLHTITLPARHACQEYPGMRIQGSLGSITFIFYSRFNLCRRWVKRQV
jgi:hypothetical protein